MSTGTCPGRTKVLCRTHGHCTAPDACWAATVNGKQDLRVLLADRRWIRLSWELCAASLAVLGGLLAIEIVVSGASPLRLVLAVLAGLAGVGLVVNRAAMNAWTRRRAEQEASFIRILRGLSRSISPDAVVTAILDELRGAAGADHVVVARLLPGGSTVQATLVSSNASVPVSVMRFPLPAPTMPRDISGRVGVPVVPDGESTASSALGLATAGAGYGPAATGSAIGPWKSGRGNLSRTPVRATVATGASAETAGTRAPVAAVGAAAVAAAAGAGPAARAFTGNGSAVRGGLAEHQMQGSRGGRGAVASHGPTAGTAPAMVAGTIRRARAGEMGRATAGETHAASGKTRAMAGATRAAVDETTAVAPEGASLARRIADRVRVAYGLQHLLSVPLAAESGVVGALILSRRTDEAWSVESQRLLDDAAQEVAAALTRAYAQEEAEARATTDALTGLPNRGYFDELTTILGHGRRSTDTLGMLMVDIDHFKRFNDRYGHAAGDAVLRAVAGAIAGTIRTDDVPARYGGEEFVVVLRRASPEQVAEVAERVRAAVSALDLTALGIAGRVSVSVGAAVGRGEGPLELVQRADVALLEAKRRGRDRVVVG